MIARLGFMPWQTQEIRYPASLGFQIAHHVLVACFNPVEVVQLAHAQPDVHAVGVKFARPFQTEEVDVGRGQSEVLKVAANDDVRGSRT